MRHIIVLLALAGYAAGASAQGSKSEVTHSGEFRARHFTDDDGTTNMQAQQLRFKGGLTYRASDKFTGHMTVLAAQNFGVNAVAGSTVDGAATVAGSENLFFNEAYGQWMASDELMVKVGRFNMNFGDGSIISSNDWEQSPRSLDGVLVSYDTEFAKFTVGGVKHTNTAENILNGATLATPTAGTANAEMNSWMLLGELKTLPEFLKTAAIHVIQTNQGAATLTGDGAMTINKENVMRFGVTLKGDMAGADYRLVYDQHMGESDAAGTKTDITGSMIDAEVGYSLPDLMALRFYVNYHMDSGSKDDNTEGRYRPFMYYRHFAAGMQDVLDWGNLTYINVGASVKPMDDLEVAVAYYMFTASDDKDLSNAGGARATGEADLGTEIDFSIKKKYGDNFAIWARYSTFSFGDGFGGSPKDRSQMFLEAAMSF